MRHMTCHTYRYIDSYQCIHCVVMVARYRLGVQVFDCVHLVLACFGTLAIASITGQCTYNMQIDAGLPHSALHLHLSIV